MQDSIYEPCIEKLAARVAQLKVGDGLLEGVDQGPLRRLLGRSRRSSGSGMSTKRFVWRGDGDRRINRRAIAAV
jgi:hypothetical protein